MVTTGSDKPTAQAHAIMERGLKLVRECRAVLLALERSGELGESSSAKAERILSFTLRSAIDAGLIRTLEDALQVLGHASRPLGPMGAEWLEKQEQKFQGQRRVMTAVSRASAGGCRWTTAHRINKQEPA